MGSASSHRANCFALLRYPVRAAVIERGCAEGFVVPNHFQFELDVRVAVAFAELLQFGLRWPPTRHLASVAESLAFASHAIAANQFVLRFFIAPIKHRLAPWPPQTRHLLPGWKIASNA